MRYLALAADYDGTLATEERLNTETMAALRRLRASGRRIILVTGRRLADINRVCPDCELFDFIVAENGALIYNPRSRQETLLAGPPPTVFIEHLEKSNIPFERGRIILETTLPFHTHILQAIQKLGLELLIIFNKGSVMVLPPGINKATGLDYALRELGLSFHEAVGIGDAENDHSFLERCECSAAVANAVPKLLEETDIVMRNEAGRGVVELIDELVDNDLSRVSINLEKHFIAVGQGDDGKNVTIPPYGINVLIAGPSASGKSTITSGIMERLMHQAYQICVVDPEGDYGMSSKNLITLGHQRHAVEVGEAMAILEDPKINLNVNLLGWPLSDRPAFFGEFFPGVRSLRTRAGRPHWIILDEAHHMLPKEWGHLQEALPWKLGETILVTVHPGQLPGGILSLMDIVIAVGPQPEKTLGEFSSATGLVFNSISCPAHRKGYAVVWFPRRKEPPVSVRIIPASGEHLRHRRKYAEGDMRHSSFYFRGPNGRHNLKTQNLVIFSVIAQGIDEETWLYHLYQGDYTRWFRESIKDPYLADQTERIQQRKGLKPEETRKLILNLIEARYTLPE
ncbi:MAG: HAD-IIB family hydrolase [Verrucomicrobiae bacterium]|nr:HAD-IIB family hydrolase [Verrucomicrobiae bacterium]